MSPKVKKFNDKGTEGAFVCADADKIHEIRNGVASLAIQLSSIERDFPDTHEVSSSIRDRVKSICAELGEFEAHLRKKEQS